jgi:hypothetical protein
MANAANTLILIAVSVAVHAAQAADPATSNEPHASGSARPEPDIAAPAEDGAQHFATHCAMCHKPAELARRLRGAADPKAARADLAAFLAGHGRSGADADAAIIDYLANSRAP